MTPDDLPTVTRGVTRPDWLAAAAESWPVIAVAWAVGGAVVWATWTGRIFG